MHKTVTITIGGSLFHVEETAYDRLDAYLRSVRAHFATYPDSEEIVQDIESRIAEDFFAALGARKKVITEKDVEKLIKKMGTVEDFEAFEGDGISKKERHAQHGETAEQAEERQNAPKQWGRLYRDADDQMLGGVCAGIAKWLGVDPTLVRLVFAASVLLGGMGVVLYIMLWIIVPEAKTTSEKVEMTQGKVTLTAIQKKIEEKLPKERRNGILRKIIDVPFAVLRAVGRLMAAVIPLLGRVFGGLIAVGGALGIAALTTGTIFLLRNPTVIDAEIPLTEILGRGTFLVLLACGYLVALLPLVFVIMLGACLLAMRNVITWQSTVAMTVLWFAALTGGLATAGSVAPAVNDQIEIYEATIGNRTERTFALQNFRAVQAEFNTELVVVQGPWSVKITGPAADVNAIQAAVDPEIGLSLQRTMPNRRRCFFFCEKKRIRMEVSMPELERVMTLDAARADVRGFSGGTLTLVSMMGSRITADVAPDTLVVESTEGSRVTVTGTADTLKATLSHGSHLEAAGLTASAAIVDLRMGSHMAIRATGSITGVMEDVARLEYLGNPSVTVETREGAEIERFDDDRYSDW